MLWKTDSSHGVANATPASWWRYSEVLLRGSSLVQGFWSTCDVLLMLLYSVSRLQVVFFHFFVCLHYTCQIKRHVKKKPKKQTTQVDLIFKRKKRKWFQGSCGFGGPTCAVFCWGRLGCLHLSFSLSCRCCSTMPSTPGLIFWAATSESQREKRNKLLVGHRQKLWTGVKHFQQWES